MILTLGFMATVFVGLCFFLEFRHPAVWETLLFLGGFDKVERAEWIFVPEQFSFSDTNRIYEVVFEPQRPLPHEIKLLFDERIKVHVSPGLIDGYFREDMLTGMVTRVTVKRCGTDEILKESICKDSKAGWVFDHRSGTNNAAQVESTLFSFSPHKWNRCFRDRLKIHVQLLCPPKCHRFGKGETVHLVVAEGYPFK